MILIEILAAIAARRTQTNLRHYSSASLYLVVAGGLDGWEASHLPLTSTSGSNGRVTF